MSNIEEVYVDAFQILREGVEKKEEMYNLNDNKEPYTKDLGSYVDGCFRDIALNRMEEKLDELPASVSEAVDEAREIEDLKDELGYWRERFGMENKSTGLSKIGLKRTIESLESATDKDIDTIVGPAVGGIEPGILYQEMADVDEFEFVGYGEKTRNKPRDVAFKTDNAKGNVGVVEDSVSSGASVIGAINAFDTEEVDEWTVIDQGGTIYEVSGSPSLERLKNTLPRTESDADYLIVDQEEVSVENISYDIQENIAPKAAAYGLGLGMIGVSVNAFIEGHGDMFINSLMTGSGALYTGLEFTYDGFSEMLKDEF